MERSQTLSLRPLARILEVGAYGVDVCLLTLRARFGCQRLLDEFRPLLELSRTNTDAAIAKSGKSDVKVLVTRRTGGQIDWDPSRDLWLHEELVKVTADCPPVEMNAEDPLFILYTSGSTGKPKGVMHTTGGYLVYAALTFRYVFNYRTGDIYWCTADVGWVTGHSYIVYGPLACGAGTSHFRTFISDNANNRQDSPGLPAGGPASIPRAL